MSWCTECVPTVVEVRDVEVIPRSHRHIVSSVGPQGAWTLCGLWIPLKRLRVLSRDPRIGKLRAREEEQHVQSWEADDVHRACSERHFAEKVRYRIGSGPWRWLWHPQPSAPAEGQSAPVTVAEARSRLTALEGALEAPRPSWWRRWLRRAA